MNARSAQDVELDRIVTGDVIRRYREDGAVCIRQAFDPHWMSVVEAGVARNLAAFEVERA